MNIDDLKTTWQTYDQKLQTSQLINHRLVESIITERSRSRLAKVQKEFVAGSILTLGCTTICVAILTGNPFDHKSIYEFTPIIILCMAFVTMLLLMGKAFWDLKKIDLHQNNVGNTLRQIINIYGRPRKLLRWTVVVMFSASLLFPLSFLPRKLAHSTLPEALVDTLIPMTISLAIYFIAAKLGAFNDHNGEYFKEYLRELEELRALSSDLLN